MVMLHKLNTPPTTQPLTKEERERLLKAMKEPVAGKTKGVEDAHKCSKKQRKIAKYFTRNGFPYYRCHTCGEAWWPDREDGTKLGIKWTI